MLLAAVDFDNLHQVLRVLYDEMMPLCSNMTVSARRTACSSSRKARTARLLAICPQFSPPMPSHTTPTVRPEAVCCAVT